MAKMKKVLALALAATMTVSMLAGCGDEKDSTEETTSETEAITEIAPDTATEAETEEVSEEEATTEELGVSDGDIVIDLNFDDGETGDCGTYFKGGQAELSNENGELKFDIKRNGMVDYANQIYYDGFRLYQGAVYEFSFDVHSTIERGLQYRLQINGSDYHAYMIDDITIGTETQHITQQFTMEEDSDPAPRMCMNLGHFEGIGDDTVEHAVYFDNIQLKVIDASNAQQVESMAEPLKVNVNQLGYKPDAQKLVSITDSTATSYEVINTDSGASVLSGEIGDWGYDSNVEEKYYIADISGVTDNGTYKVVLDTGEESYEFAISDDVYVDVYKDSVLMLYNQRCGTALDSSISGDFAHEACHTGKAVVYGTNEELDVTGGWHDAGDYGRYVVSGAKSVQDLLLTYEDSEDAAKDDAIGIPESGNGVPDVLDEARYELDWMLKMQDASSGGVYHKVTGEVFPETVLAVEETAQMILSPISNAATGDFAAVMAKASVIYKDYDADFAAACLAAAENAWKYLQEHDGDSPFKNVGDIVTGEYPDNSYGDEYLWAAAELYIATGDESYNDYFNTKISETVGVSYGLGWADVGYYALYDYCRNVKDCDTAKDMLKQKADNLINNYSKSATGSTVRGSYAWGSNMTVANNGMLLLMASKVLGDDSYVNYAADQLNYLLGRNAVSYCYVTGYGAQSPKNTHHRPSQVLGKSMPGMLVGGPDADLEDSYAKAVLTGLPPERCYADNSQSYSCNEVTVYWNSPLVYLLAAFK